MMSIDNLKEVAHGLFKEPITGPLKSKMAKIRHLGCWRQDAKTRFSGKLSNSVSCNWAFQRTNYWIPKIQDAEIRHLENRHDVIFFCRGWSDLDKMSETGAEWHVDCGDVVKIETRCRIPIWRTFGRITYHIAGCCHLVNSLSRFQSHMQHCRVQSPGEINVMIVPHCRV